MGTLTMDATPKKYVLIGILVAVMFGIAVANSVMHSQHTDWDKWQDDMEMFAPDYDGSETGDER